MKKLVSWIEIPSTDFDRAVGFYSHVLETRLEPLDFGTEKMACFPSGEGAVSFAPGFEPSAQGVIVSLNAGNHLDAMLGRIEAAGGKITCPKTKIEAEGRGYFALFTDTEGNRLGLYGDA